MRTQAMVFLALTFFTGSAFGEVMEIDAKGYYTRVADPSLIELSNKITLQRTFTRHILYESEIGTESHWCSGSNVLGKRNLVGGGGSCVVLDGAEDGYWLWFEVVPGVGYEWKVMKGFGKYKGANGSGVARSVENLTDGSGIFHSKGSIEIP
jgi:hypothetical protein